MIPPCGTTPLAAICGTFNLNNIVEYAAWRPQNTGKSFSGWPLPQEPCTRCCPFVPQSVSQSGLRQQNSLGPSALFRQLAHWYVLYFKFSDVTHCINQNIGLSNPSVDRCLNIAVLNFFTR